MTNNGDVRLAAANKVDSNGSNVAIEVAKGNELGLWGTTLSAGQVNLAGGTIGVWKNSAVTSGVEVGVNPAGVVSRTDGSAASVLRDASSSVTPSTAFTESSEVQPPALPTETPLSAQDEENIDTGRMAAQDALDTATSKEEAVASLVKKIAKLNEKVAESPRQTAGIVVGMVKEIAETSALNAADKLDLQRAVLDAYAPVQELKDEQDHHAVRTLADAVRAAENTLVTATTHEHDSRNVQPVTFTD